MGASGIFFRNKVAELPSCVVLLLAAGVCLPQIAHQADLASEHEHAHA
jgi:hypothetical protein